MSDAGVQVVRSAAPGLVELHVRAWPDPAPRDFEAQAHSMYARLDAALREHGATTRDLVAERVFLGDIAAQGPLLGARAHAFTRVQQPPLAPGRACEVLALAVLGADRTPLPSHVPSRLPDRASGRAFDNEGLRHLYLASVTGGSPGDGLDVESQATAMFQAAEQALQAEGLSYSDVVRTWIYIHDIGRDYDAMNRARRSFFSARGIDPPPASTGIGGAVFPPDRACALDLRAIGARTPGGSPVLKTRLRSERMSEAPSYGADFARGMRIDLPGRALLYLSGTASVDSQGHVAHPGDRERQIEWTLLNIESLLASQGAHYEHLVSATTYFTHRDGVDEFRRVAERRGWPDGVPNVLCLADICRPDWLFEIEATAVLRV